MPGGRENLIPFTKETASYYGRLGAIKANETKRRKKAMRETLNELLKLKLKGQKNISNLKQMGVKPQDINHQTAICAVMITKAEQGSVKAAEFVRDTIGEGPNQTAINTESTGVTDALLKALQGRNNSFDE